MTSDRQIIYVPPGAGDVRNGPTGPYLIKAAAEATGTYGLIENTLPPGQHHAPHTHANSEAFYVLAGSFEFEVGGEKYDAPAGTFLFIPPHVPHGYVAGAQGATKLNIVAT